jgi:hypothetical protein
MFDLGKWLAQLLKTNAQYKRLRSFVLDAEAFSEHVRKIGFVDHENDYSIKAIDDPNLKKIVEDSTKEELYDSLSHYARLMIVTYATYMEAMISEFFNNIFLQKPECMYDYLNDESARVGKGYIKLNDILQADSLEEAKSNLAVRAVKNAVNGPISVISKRITKLSKYNIDSELIEKVDRIFVDRNLIIHEAEDIKISYSDISDVWETANDLLKELGNICKSMNVQYSDPAFLIDERL